MNRTLSIFSMIRNVFSPHSALDIYCYWLCSKLIGVKDIVERIYYLPNYRIENLFTFWRFQVNSYQWTEISFGIFVWKEESWESLYRVIVDGSDKLRIGWSLSSTSNPQSVQLLWTQSNIISGIEQNANVQSMLTCNLTFESDEFAKLSIWLFNWSGMSLGNRLISV